MKIVDQGLRYMRVGFPQRIESEELGLSLSLLGKVKPLGVMQSLLSGEGGTWMGGDGGRQWLIQPASVHVFIPLLQQGLNSEAQLELINAIHPTLSSEYLRIKARYDGNRALEKLGYINTHSDYRLMC